MATVQRKNTVKIVFPEHAQRPTPMAVHDWIADYLKLTADQVDMIQLHTVERTVYIKLISIVHYERLLHDYEGDINFQYDDNTIIKVHLQQAEGNITTVRIFNLPSEIENNVVSQALSAYGVVKGVRSEMWNSQYKIPVHNGVRAVRIELRKHIPNKVFIAGSMSMAYYTGQPQVCHICGESSHLRYDCPRKPFGLPVTTPGRKPLLSEVVEGKATKVNNSVESPVNPGINAVNLNTNNSGCEGRDNDVSSPPRDAELPTQEILHVISDADQRSPDADSSQIADKDTLLTTERPQDSVSHTLEEACVQSNNDTIVEPEEHNTLYSDGESTASDIEVQEHLSDGTGDSFSQQSQQLQTQVAQSSPAAIDGSSDAPVQVMEDKEQISTRDPRLTREHTIRWLAEEATKRYRKIQTLEKYDDKKFIVEELRKTRGGVILDFDDTIKDVLDDNDFVTAVLPAEHHIGSVIPENLKHILEPVPSKFEPSDEYLYLDGCSLSTNDLRQLGKGVYKIKLTHEAELKIKKARQLVEKILQEKKVVYGITTGFGKFARTVIDADKLEELQYNLIRSHAAGVGTPLDPEKTRMLLALRINVLAKGHSGISLNTLYMLIKAFNASCLSWVPTQGSVGASGDLAPLAHLALGLLGEGQMWSPGTGWGNAKEVLAANGLIPMKLSAKEGIALINGTQLITSLGAEAVERAFYIARQADVVAALTLEVLKGTSRAFDSDVQMIRPHKGQIAVAKRLRALLHSDTYPSQIAESHRFCNRVQDAYTLRCCPQVHGIVHDTIDFVQGVITVEMNSGTDNPIVFADRGEIISAGNFHGEYPAKVLDYLAVAVHELASMSERRIERLVNPALSELPAFLVKDGGLNSGFMLAHCTAASLVSENKALCHPASVDSLSTSAGTEDHVSMGCFAARKALQVVENVERVIAIELLAACQAIEFLRPLKTTVPLEEVYNVVRSVVRPWDKDRYMAPDIASVTTLLLEDKIWNAVKHHIDFYHAPEEVETRVFSPTAVMVGEKQRERPHSESSTKKRRLNDI